MQFRSGSGSGKGSVLRGKMRYSFVGTPDYLAPEVLLGQGHGTPVDWWALGIIAYEFLTGIPPFNDESPQQIFENILERRIEWPDEMSADARDLIEKLLGMDPKTRLGARGASELKSHPFFATTRWTTLQKDTPPFLPVTGDITDLSYFDPGKH